MRKIVSLLPVLLLLCTFAFGQTRTVTGTVKGTSGSPIPFATITENGTKNESPPMQMVPSQLQLKLAPN